MHCSASRTARVPGPAWWWCTMRSVTALTTSRRRRGSPRRASSPSRRTCTRAAAGPMHHQGHPRVADAARPRARRHPGCPRSRAVDAGVHRHRRRGRVLHGWSIRIGDVAQGIWRLGTVLRHTAAAQPQRDPGRGVPDRGQLRPPRPARYRRSRKLRKVVDDKGITADIKAYPDAGHSFANKLPGSAPSAGHRIRLQRRCDRGRLSSGLRVLQRAPDRVAPRPPPSPRSHCAPCRCHHGCIACGTHHHACHQYFLVTISKTRRFRTWADCGRPPRPVRPSACRAHLTSGW